jgi:hypothetical protein
MRKSTDSKHSLPAASWLLSVFFDPEDAGSMFLETVGWLSSGYMVFYPKI